MLDDPQLITRVFIGCLVLMSGYRDEQEVYALAAVTEKRH